MTGAVADVNPITVSPKILGDLAPIDAGLTTAGIQYSYDALGNVKVSNTAEPNRIDSLIDSTGNDHAWGGLGNDGNDVILGGHDSDTLRGDGIEFYGTPWWPKATTI